ncbi:hypothetical protein PN419_00240 [Halorubrum ezzemoulense]|uniref:hypothetical protein n=1 Tax=Halorubrum ezzemoulense TaxID=337243 RepID=UPI00232B543A|nr:hypothetical protein [Halorubrum ezzemoulense]MDB9247435.1 hypothetical protein [Halorubrum ezzemoulense]MDB9258656.1 hypothetical protein [Halorubrum ezzemoulense]MDB9264486.1 hypothetical protein [Halorubrum ezzemoulense]MDB9269017.1 hypothetical protein [Halorubrum ezzemoulense]MDB9271454.1 hypothetical protein [Halorubrum ezzemoulense]
MADDYASVGDVDLSRRQVTVDGDEYRMYTDGERDWPSVSTILDARPTPEKDKQIEGWRNWLKGQPDRPDPSDVMRYKSYRGTLAHYKGLKDLATYDLAGDEEFDAYQGLKGWEYRHDDALTQATDDIEWFLDEFRSLLDDWGIARWEDDELVRSNVRRVEQYVMDDEIGYAGQYDLAYDLPDGTTVVGDIKTSKADSVDDLFDKKFPRYGLQLAAYANAVDFEVDACHIIWVAPDTKESAVITDSQWPESRASYEQMFASVAETVHQTTFNEF